MFFKLKTYVNFITKATNQHGVHSPFVYDLVTKCLYKSTPKKTTLKLKQLKQKQNPSKGMKLGVLKRIHRLVTYFDFSEILILSNHFSVLSKTINLEKQRNIAVDLQTNHKYDLIFIDASLIKTKHAIESLMSVTHNDSLILIKSISETPNQLKLWKQLKNNPKVRVTINTFDLGFVFVRKEQAKEHFIIRR